MKLLLDENLPKRLKLDFENHEIYTVLVLNTKDNSYLTLSKLIPRINDALNSNLNIGATEISE